MTVDDVMTELQSLGTAQNVKIYRRHGAGDNLYGVSFANLQKIAKRIKTDHELAQRLWASGNTDARSLALMIADPQRATAALLEQWVKDTGYYGLVDMLSGFAAKTRFAREKMEKWTHSRDEWIGQAGWSLLAHIAMQDADLPQNYFESYLEIIRREIHERPNRTRHAMNNALIAIGIRNDSLRKKALAAAKAIGKVEVDHGETSCKTPDAATYIDKTWKRKAERKTKCRGQIS